MTMYRDKGSDKNEIAISGHIHPLSVNQVLDKCIYAPMTSKTVVKL